MAQNTERQPHNQLRLFVLRVGVFFCLLSLAVWLMAIHHYHYLSRVILLF